MRALLAAAALTCAFPASAAPAPASYWAPTPYSQVHNAPWSHDAVLYQLNTRQFTREGTFRAAQRELPRLKALGVDIVWLMPIHPIGVKNRKGTLGSPYSVRDYYAVNPEFGTLADFKAFVAAAHAQGMHVILDLVANHTAWDNALAVQHPDWYEKDWKGDFRPTPWLDWSDIIDLDWSKTGVREHVGGAMEYWVREAGVDGYRADVAGYVPLDFWEKARARLEKIRPVFMLAEWKTPELTRHAFDAVYAWDWHNGAKDIAQGRADATAFYGYYAENESAWPRRAMRMTYIENHDSNSWEGTTKESFGPALAAMTALSFTTEGLPLVYNGMEACNAKRLEFFEKDPIDWGQAKGCTQGALIHDLIAFRKANPALRNGEWGARMVKLDNDQPKQLFSWVRTQGPNQVVGLFNLSGKPVTATLTTAHAAGTYREFRNGGAVTLKAGSKVSLAPWSYQLLARST